VYFLVNSPSGSAVTQIGGGFGLLEGIVRERNIVFPRYPRGFREFSTIHCKLYFAPISQYGTVALVSAMELRGIKHLRRVIARKRATTDI
jgi:hypothetical protein